MSTVVFLRRVSESDWLPFGDPLPYDEAVKILSNTPIEHLEHLDLQDCKSGRLVSWMVGE